jgi:hypothetical protein
MRPCSVFCAFILALLPTAPVAWAKDYSWSASFYAGPATNNYASQIFSGQFKVDGAMAGLALDRNLLDFGPHFRLIAEGQVTHYFSSAPTTTLNVGLGLRYERLLSNSVPVSISAYMGPSYAMAPPIYLTASGTTARYRLLNYLSAEVAFGLSRTSGWDLVFREYHRSGMYGLYATDVDEGSMLGIGLRRRF